MAKSRRKGRKKKYRLSEGKFRNKVCKNCTVCSAPSGSFCFAKYQESPEKYWHHAVPKLQALPEWPSSTAKTMAEEMVLFEDIFCAGACDRQSLGSTGECRKLMGCFNDFEDQLTSENLQHAFAYHKKNNGSKKKKKNKTKSVKFVAKPTFFCNDPEIWKIRIEKTFNENNHIEQDKDTRSSSAAEDVPY